MTQTSFFKNPYLLVPSKYGGVGGMLSILLFLILMWLGENPLISGSMFGFFFIPIFVFFSIKEFKTYYNAGYLHFWQGMSIGFFCYMLLALLYALFVWVYLQSFDPEMLQAYVADRVALVMDTKSNLTAQLGEAVYEKTLADLQQVSAFDMALDSFLRKIFVGFFVTTLVSVVMRRSPVVVNK